MSKKNIWVKKRGLESRKFRLKIFPAGGFLRKKFFKKKKNSTHEPLIVKHGKDSGRVREKMYRGYFEVKIKNSAAGYSEMFTADFR